MAKITLRQAARWCGGFVEEKYADVEFFGANNDTRVLQPGQLFVVLQGARDGHDFIPAAMKKGAAAVLCKRKVGDYPAIYVEDPRTALGLIARQEVSRLGMKVVGYDPYLDAERAAAISPTMKFVTELDELLVESKFLTIHVPALPSTKGMINADALAKLPEGAVVLNFARDTLVDDAAMAQAIESGHVAKYVTDFANPAVMAMDKVIVLPHLGASTEEAEDNCAKMAVAEIMDYLENGVKRFCVNMK